MQPFPTPPTNTRLGFHYFPDTLHYREIDLKTWRPELRALGASWITLLAPIERAIPEFFLNGLQDAGIEPILHFHLPLEFPSRSTPLHLLFKNYARWGIHYVALYDRPNLRLSWSPAAWAQADLVERFLDLYIPAAETALLEGLIPVFPPLEPGGDYWDTAFLRSALHGMQRRNRSRLLDALVIGAYAWAGNRPLNWGAGGPERWPGSRPYFTPQGMQDQRGFRIFDWYSTISQAELGEPRPVILLKAGSPPGDHSNPLAQEIDQPSHTLQNLSIARLMTAGLYGKAGQDAGGTGALVQDKFGPLESAPAEVLACNFWLLAASTGSPEASQAWFRTDGSRQPIVDELRQWAALLQIPNQPVSMKSISPNPAASPVHPISHYLLLPLFDWGVPDWHLDAIRPFIKKHHPTIGFSLSEAALAARVTVVGGVQAFSEDALDALRAAGCDVERMIADGTLVAT